MRKTIFIFGLVFLLAVSTFAAHQNVIWGNFVKYKSSTEIYITAGSGRCNSTEWENAAETTLSLSAVLPAGEDFVYIYVDDSASSYPTPTFIGSTTEPTWNNTLIGWYNGDDRCIGSVRCDSSGNIPQFQNNTHNEYITISPLKQVQSGGNPSGAYQTCEATAYIPVNADSVYVFATNTDLNGPVRVIVSSYENLYSSIMDDSYWTNAGAVGWISLERGASRDFKWFGWNDDDNSFDIYIRGFRIER